MGEKTKTDLGSTKNIFDKFFDDNKKKTPMLKKKAQGYLYFFFGEIKCF